jgi:hypothetical protein
MRGFRFFPVSSSLTLFALGCASSSPRSHIEDGSRRVAPLPACILQLPARRSESAGSLRTLRDEQVMKLLFPSFNEETRSLPERAVACTGAHLFEDPSLQKAQLIHTTWPLSVAESDLTYGSGADRIKLVWLRTHRFGDGTEAGPLAAYRSGERVAELFAVGLYRSMPDPLRFGTRRRGGDYLVTAENDGCSTRKPNSACQTTMSVLLPFHGVLTPVVDVPLERYAYSGKAERGSQGPLEYRLTSVPTFDEDRIRVLEQVRIHDDAGREIRKSEHERIFTIGDDGRTRSNEPSLWDQIVKTK